MSEAIGRAEMQMELQAISRPASVARLRVSDYLPENRVTILPPGLSKEQIIRDLMARLDLPNPTQAFQAVLDREKTGSTVIGSGIAVPHARLEGLTDLQAALGLSPKGPVYLWIVFVGPKDNPQLHLAFLSGISSLFQDEGRMGSLVGLASPADIADYIRRAERAAG